jgi:hypothetical protein
MTGRKPEAFLQIQFQNAKQKPLEPPRPFSSASASTQLLIEPSRIVHHPLSLEHFAKTQETSACARKETDSRNHFPNSQNCNMQRNLPIGLRTASLIPIYAHRINASNSPDYKTALIPASPTTLA